MAQPRRPKEIANKEIQEDGPTLFTLPPQSLPEPKIKSLQFPVWTETKAQLIERYLYYFVLITRHGTYIDGFAGPQQPDRSEMWAANVVIESEPKRLNHFYLFDKGRTAIRSLKRLRDDNPNRDIVLYQGDFNEKIRELLQSGTIKRTEATFCLLDRRTFECHWASVKAIAEYKTSGYKVELFYFLPNSWLERAFSGLKKADVLRQWWERSDWSKLLDMDRSERLEAFRNRFKEELGYATVKAWLIYEKQNSGTIMYYMIHATDHPEAPKLMERAYNQAVLPKESEEQLEFNLGIV
jgi:three-Cys-motif partner protein